MKDYSKISGRDLSETLNYLWEVKNRLEKDYCHVSGFVSDYFKNSIDQQIERINKELNKRV